MKKIRAYLIAGWRVWWCMEPRMCFRHELAKALRKPDYRGCEDPRCVRYR